MIDIDTYLNQVGILYAEDDYDDYGKPKQGVGQTIPVRFRRMFKVERLSNNEELQLDGEVYVRPSQSVDVNQIFEYEGVLYRVIGFKEAYSMDGVLNHKVLMLTIYGNH